MSNIVETNTDGVFCIKDSGAFDEQAILEKYVITSPADMFATDVRYEKGSDGITAQVVADWTKPNFSLPTLFDTEDKAIAAGVSMGFTFVVVGQVKGLSSDLREEVLQRAKIEAENKKKEKKYFVACWNAPEEHIFAVVGMLGKTQQRTEYGIFPSSNRTFAVGTAADVEAISDAVYRFELLEKPIAEEIADILNNSIPIGAWKFCGEGCPRHGWRVLEC